MGRWDKRRKGVPNKSRYYIAIKSDKYCGNFEEVNGAPPGTSEPAVGRPQREMTTVVSIVDDTIICLTDSEGSDSEIELLPTPGPSQPANLPPVITLDSPDVGRVCTGNNPAEVGCGDDGSGERTVVLNRMSLAVTVCQTTKLPLPDPSKVMLPHTTVANVDGSRSDVGTTRPSISCEERINCQKLDANTGGIDCSTGSTNCRATPLLAVNNRSEKDARPSYVYEMTMFLKNNVWSTEMRLRASAQQLKEYDSAMVEASYFNDLAIRVAARERVRKLTSEVRAACGQVDDDPIEIGQENLDGNVQILEVDEGKSTFVTNENRARQLKLHVPHKAASLSRPINTSARPILPPPIGIPSASLPPAGYRGSAPMIAAGQPGLNTLNLLVNSVAGIKIKSKTIMDVPIAKDSSSQIGNSNRQPASTSFPLTKFVIPLGVPAATASNWRNYSSRASRKRQFSSPSPKAECSNKTLFKRKKLARSNWLLPPPSPQSLIQGDSSYSSAAHSTYLPFPIAFRRIDESRLRPIAIDGSNVAFSHGRDSLFSCKGIAICVSYFLQRGHRNVKAFVPQYRRQFSHQVTDKYLLEKLSRGSQHIVFTPSRTIGGKDIVPYDDRFIVDYATKVGGVIVSNDNYRDLMQENPEWKVTIEKRLLMFTFADDVFMIPEDPLGKHGPCLHDFLRF